MKGFLPSGLNFARGSSGISAASKKGPWVFTRGGNSSKLSSTLLEPSSIVETQEVMAPWIGSMGSDHMFVPRRSTFMPVSRPHSRMSDQFSGVAAAPPSEHCRVLLTVFADWANNGNHFPLHAVQLIRYGNLRGPNRTSERQRRANTTLQA